MRKLLVVVLLFACSVTFAQDSLKNTGYLNNFNHTRNLITATGMGVLGTWSVANVAIGAYGWSSTTGATRYFYQMNVIWNVVNFGTAVVGFTNIQRNKNKKLTLAESLAEQKKIERTFLINGGLDVVYIGAGAFLKSRGNSRNADDLKGYGTAVILQGAFLLLFDGTMYSAERGHGNRLRAFLEKNPITFDGKRVGIILNM